MRASAEDSRIIRVESKLECVSRREPRAIGARATRRAAFPGTAIGSVGVARASQNHPTSYREPAPRPPPPARRARAPPAPRARAAPTAALPQNPPPPPPPPRLDIRAGQSKGPPPMVMERFQSVASQLMSQRIIRLGGAVDDDSCNLIVAQLLWLDAQDPNKDITIYVNSPGGSVTAGMAVFDTMRHVRPDVSTVCVGLAASMGAFLLASGQKGKRYSLPNSRIMIHQPLGGAQGQAADIEIQANEIQHHKSTLNGYLAEFCGKPLDTVMEDTDRDFFMSAAEAKEYGLVDLVIDNPTEIAAKESGIPMYAGDNL